MSQRKTIRLRADYQRPDEEPRRYKVLFESDELMELDGGHIIGISTYVKLPDGALTNRFRNVRYTIVKPDRRPKPYAVQYDGCDGTATRKFATLAEAAQYVWDRYQGVEYFDGPAGFHTDYGGYSLHGFTLADIYNIDYPNWHATRKEGL